MLPGVCAPLKDLGEACNDLVECDSTLCVDGVCCDQTCTGQCQACNDEGSVGNCVTIGSPSDPKAPVDAADACNGSGTACGGVCDGSNPNACFYPDGTEPEPAVCACDASNTSCSETHQICDANGGSTETVADCNGHLCADESTCATSCVDENDCIEDFICPEGTCEPLTGPTCDGNATLWIPAGPDQSCDPYRCDPTQCRTSCESVDHCVQGHLCNDAGECVTDIEAPEVASCSCHVPGAPAQRDLDWLSLLATLAALTPIWRRRHRRAL